MVYHQSAWNSLIRGGLYYGLMKGGFFKGKNIHRLIQENTDGALARYYTLPGLKQELSGKFDIINTSLIGNKMQLLPLKYGPLKIKAARCIPDRFGRWLTNRPFFGYMVVTHCRRIG